MKSYKEMSSEELKKVPLVVFGCGKWGEKCANHLEQNGIFSFCFSDSDQGKWGKICAGHEIISADEMKDIKGVHVVIAIEDYAEPLEMIEKMGIKDILLYMDKKIYQSVPCCILGKWNYEEVVEELKKKKVILCGEEKYIEDFAYIFDWLLIEEKIIGYEVPRYQENRLVIVCADKKEAIQEITTYGYEENQSFIYAEMLFPLLDEGNRIVGKIPSIMLRKTIKDTMKAQIKCMQPFQKLQLSSNFTVRSCCGDWAESWGNLNANSMEEIWNSDIAKIVRLSIMNRTYSFCNASNCVHMVIDPESTNERFMPLAPAASVPEYIEVGIDKTCNLYCKSCRNEICVESGERRKKIERIAENIKKSGWLEKTEVLLLGGQGEVFFSPVYQSLMYDVESRRKTLDLRTNGVLLSEEKFARLADKYERLRIIVSVDAATKETYDKLRRSHNKDTWNQLMSNLQMLSKERKGKSLSFFQINMCVQMDNYREIPDFVRLGEQLGCDRVYLTPIRNWGTYEPEQFRNISIFVKDKELKLEVRKVVEQVRGKSIVEMAF